MLKEGIGINCLEVDLNIIRNNAKEIKNKLPEKTKLCAVVKSNAYGLGVKEISDALYGVVDYFAVSDAEEFKVLTSQNICTPCLVLMPMFRYLDIKNVILGEGELTVTTFKNLMFIDKVAKALNKKAKVHIKIDTGMNRFGIKSTEKLEYFVENLKKTSNIDIIGVFSHLFCASNSKISKRQLMSFNKKITVLTKNCIFPIYHLANSGGVNLGKKFWLDMVRVGIDLYLANNPISFKAKVLEIKKAYPGEYVSYGLSAKQRQGKVLAVVSAGYSSGISRRFKNGGKVIINAEYAPVVGDICMDAFMVDITNIKSVKIGDSVTIIGSDENLSIFTDDIADVCGTISYEILTGISERVKRKYIKIKEENVNKSAEIQGII